jgi:hypothetical protein
MLLIKEYLMIRYFRSTMYSLKGVSRFSLDTSTLQFFKLDNYIMIEKSFLQKEKASYTCPSLIRTHVNSDGQSFLVPEPVFNPFSCISYCLIRNPELVKAGQICMLFDSRSAKMHLVLLCYSEIV